MWEIEPGEDRELYVDREPMYAENLCRLLTQRLIDVKIPSLDSNNVITDTIN